MLRWKGLAGLGFAAERALWHWRAEVSSAVRASASS